MLVFLTNCTSGKDKYEENIAENQRKMCWECCKMTLVVKEASLKTENLSKVLQKTRNEPGNKCMSRGVPGGENRKAAWETRAKWGVRRAWEVNGGGKVEIRHAGDGAGHTVRILDLTLSKGVTVWLSFSKECHCLPSAKEATRSGTEKKETSSECQGSYFHPKHLGHPHAWSCCFSRYAGAGEGGGQKISNPMHRSSVSKTVRGSRLVTIIIIPSCNTIKRKTSSLSKAS